MSTLIIDAGSSKMEWILLDGKEVLVRFTTDGFNPNYADKKRLKSIIDSIPDEIRRGTNLQPQTIYYYGTGCGSEQNCQIVYKVFHRRFRKADIHVTHDLMAACHAVLGNKRGIACILGTGANSCLYDGTEITERAVSLGYLLGDEGSGCYIGRKLVRAYFYDLMPLELKLSFNMAYQLEIKEFIHRVYQEPEASKYLAGFTKFAGEHLAHPFIQQLVKESFKEFLQVFVMRYKDCRSLPVSFVGSVAFAFQDLLRESLEAEGLTMGEVIQTPAEGLIRYYGAEK